MSQFLNVWGLPLVQDNERQQFAGADQPTSTDVSESSVGRSRHDQNKFVQHRR